jgi:ABC-type Fe3+-hydroxamate transport system substrate-binding protein
MIHESVESFGLPPERVVSLVPSMTESLFELGLGAALVGCTEFCVHPAEKTAALPKVGGTKNARVEDILALKPDLIIANKEENSRELVEALAAAGMPVWLTFPKSVDEAVQILYDLAGLFRNQTALLAVRSLAGAVDYARAASRQPARTFCPIWFEAGAESGPWWMTFNADTYPHDLLRLLGCENVFADRERQYPLEADLGGGEPVEQPGRDTRYPRVTGEEIAAAAPGLVLLPSEPFSFKPGDEAPLRELLGEDVRYDFMDGSLLTWHGTRLAKALRLNLSG